MLQNQIIQQQNANGTHIYRKLYFMCLFNIIINGSQPKMHKIRKNSLSPCYANNNKENVQLENIQTLAEISFKNIQQARKKKTLDCQKEKKSAANSRTPPGHQDFFTKPSYTPTQCQDRQRNSKRDAEKSVQDFRSSLKSKEKQMSSLQSQVNTLNSTISLLKDQLTNLKNQNKALNEENIQNKRILKQKNQIIEKLKKEQPISPRLQSQQRNNQKIQISSLLPTTMTYTSVQKNVTANAMFTDYDEVNEKLNQLEEIQDRLLQENQQLKKKNQLNCAMLKNMKILLKNGQTDNIMELLDVLDESQDQGQTKQKGKAYNSIGIPKSSQRKQNNSIKQQKCFQNQQNTRRESFQSHIEEFFSKQGEDSPEQETIYERKTQKLKKSRAKGYYGSQRI